MADGGPVVPPAEGYYPRSKSVSPVQKKIRELEVGAGHVGAGDAWVGCTVRTCSRAAACCTHHAVVPVAHAPRGRCSCCVALCCRQRRGAASHLTPSPRPPAWSASWASLTSGEQRLRNCFGAGAGACMHLDACCVGHKHTGMLQPGFVTVGAQPVQRRGACASAVAPEANEAIPAAKPSSCHFFAVLTTATPALPACRRNEQSTSGRTSRTGGDAALGRRSGSGSPAKSPRRGSSQVGRWVLALLRGWNCMPLWRSLVLPAPPNGPLPGLRRCRRRLTLLGPPLRLSARCWPSTPRSRSGCGRRRLHRLPSARPRHLPPLRVRCVPCGTCCRAS